VIDCFRMIGSVIGETHLKSLMAKTKSHAHTVEKWRDDSARVRPEGAMRGSGALRKPRAKKLLTVNAKQAQKKKLVGSSSGGVGGSGGGGSSGSSDISEAVATAAPVSIAGGACGGGCSSGGGVQAGVECTVTTAVPTNLNEAKKQREKLVMATAVYLRREIPRVYGSAATACWSTVANVCCVSLNYFFNRQKGTGARRVDAVDLASYRPPGDRTGLEALADFPAKRCSCELDCANTPLPVLERKVALWKRAAETSKRQEVRARHSSKCFSPYP
jgi:hypothetical protein